MIRAAALAACLLMPLPALAADVVFPPGSRIGMAPLSDMEVSKRFTGFENPAKGTAFTFVEMPAEAYSQLSQGLTADALKAQGLTETRREEIKLGGADGLLVQGEQAAGAVKVRKWLVIAKDPTMTAFVIAQAVATPEGYQDADLRRAVESIAVRAPLPMEEQIDSLPFRLSERSGFRPVRVMAGNSLLLTDGPKDVVKDNEQPVLIVAQSMAPPPRPEQRADFARSALFSGAALKDLVVERSQGFRQKGADWHEIVARAKDRDSDQPVVVMQTIRFMPDGYLRAVGITRAADRDDIMHRFRAVVDSLDVK
jgi:hypothetical protein